MSRRPQSASTSARRPCCQDRFERGGRCDVGARSWIEADVEHIPGGLPATAVHARRGFCLWRELRLARGYLRTRQRDFLVRPGGSTRFASSATYDGAKVEAISDGRWSVAAKAGAEQRGEGFFGLAGALYGLPRGVAAVPLIETAFCETFDDIAAREIAEAIERNAERAAKTAGGRIA